MRNVSRRDEESILNAVTIPLSNKGQLTLSFRGSAAELSIRLQALAVPEKEFIEGSSTTLDPNDLPTQLNTAFYMAMHDVVIGYHQEEKAFTATIPDNILGKFVTMHTRPARTENMTGDATPETVTVWCTPDAEIYMRVVGQDLSFPSCTQNLVYSFGNSTPNIDPTPELKTIASHLVGLLQEFGTPTPV